MKIVITGGHFSPAYSIIQKIKDDNELLVIGRMNAFDGDSAKTLEYKICKELNIPFYNLSTGRLQRNFGIRSFLVASKFPVGTYKALKKLKDFSPDVIVTFGGYVALPVAIAGKILGIPIVLHEQTQKAGLSSLLISKFASVILVSFESSKEYFKGKNVVLTGNPLRPEFFNKNEKFSFAHPSIYITGGSTGAHFINNLVEKILPRLLTKYQIFHQAGNSSQFGDLERLKKIDNKNYKVSDFFTASEVFEILRNVDLVISRAGINTIQEIIASKAVSLLIPIKVGQKNEQLDNAIFVKENNFGEYLLQDNLTPEVLAEKISDMIDKRHFYLKSLEKGSKNIIFDSADRIVREIYRYGKRGSTKKEASAY